MPRPAHFRPPIPARIKLRVILRQDGLCHETPDRLCACGRKLDPTQINFDHVPALGLRSWNEDEEDTEPPANDPDYIAAKFKRDCHNPKTYGTRYHRRGSDQHEIRRLKEIEKRAEECGETKHDVPPAAVTRTCATWSDPVIGRRVDDDETKDAGDRDRRREYRRGRMRGPGFQTNKDGPFRKPMHGPAVRRVPRQGRE